MNVCSLRVCNLFFSISIENCGCRTLNIAKKKTKIARVSLGKYFLEGLILIFLKTYSGIRKENEFR